MESSEVAIVAFSVHTTHSLHQVEECISLLALREGTSPAAVYDMYFDVQLVGEASSGSIPLPVQSGILSESMHDNWADSDPTRKMLHELLIRSSEESLAKCLNDGKEEEGLGGQLMKVNLRFKLI